MIETWTQIRRDHAILKIALIEEKYREKSNDFVIRIAKRKYKDMPADLIGVIVSSIRELTLEYLTQSPEVREAMNV